MSEQFTIKKSTLTELGDLFRKLTGNTDSSIEDEYYFTIEDMKNTLDQTQSEIIEQSNLISRINNAIRQKGVVDMPFIKYVEDYRTDSMSDNDVINAALADLQDYEILVFGLGIEYRLNKPIILTKKDNEYKNRVGNIFLGRGCTITNGIKKIADANDSWLTNTSALFILSDSTGKGLQKCSIIDFNFKAGTIKDSNGKVLDRNKKLMGIKCTTAARSTYLQHCKISHCTFKEFSSGIYTCGADNEYSFNTFNTCYRGVYDDGSDRSYYHDNYFFTTQDNGILAQQSYATTIEHNTFYKCKYNAITLSGAQPRISLDSSSIKTIVSKNIINGSGHFLDQKTCENGIVSQGYKDLIISNNIIVNMATSTEDTAKIYGYGIHISGGYNNQSSCRMSSRVIVENNTIYAPARSGIRVRYANSVKVQDNSIYGYGGPVHGMSLYAESNITAPKNGTFSLSKPTSGGTLKFFRSPALNEYSYAYAISISLSSDVVVENNLIQNYKFNINNSITDYTMIISMDSSTRISASNNTSIEGMSWSDTQKMKSEGTTNNTPQIKNLLLNFSKSTPKIMLQNGVSYSIWIPADSSEFNDKDDPKDSNTKYYYTGLYYTDTYSYTEKGISHTATGEYIYSFKNSSGQDTSILMPKNYGYFQEIIYRLDSNGIGYFEIPNKN